MRVAVTAARMKEIDRLAQVKYGIPSIILMENAGRAAAEEILKKRRKGKAAVFCGKGNNGGDGFVVARYLAQKGVKTDVFLLAKRSEIKKDPRVNLGILEKKGMKICEVKTKKDFARIRRNFRYDIIIDAIFGIGFKGSLPKNIREAVNFMNRTGIPIYALDVPSGLDATTGKARGASIRAHETITFGVLKTGFLKKAAKPYVGKVIRKNIGFPSALFK